MIKTSSINGGSVITIVVVITEADFNPLTSVYFFSLSDVKSLPGLKSA